MVVVPCESESSTYLYSAFGYSTRSQFDCIFKVLGAAVDVEDMMKLQISLVSLMKEKFTYSSQM